MSNPKTIEFEYSNLAPIERVREECKRVHPDYEFEITRDSDKHNWSCYGTLKETVTTARENQQGGDHYKKRKIQPIDVINDYEMGFYDGNALKYLMRYKDKGGSEDLKKAMHYIQMLLEFQYGIKSEFKVNATIQE